MEKIKQLLEFLRITDSHDGLISLTSLSVLVVLAKIAFMPSASVAELGSLFVVLLSYQSKKFLNKDSNAPEQQITNEQFDSLKTKFDEVDSKVSAMSISSSIKKLSN